MELQESELDCFSLTALSSSSEPATPFGSHVNWELELTKNHGFQSLPPGVRFRPVCSFLQPRPPVLSRHISSRRISSRRVTWSVLHPSPRSCPSISELPGACLPPKHPLPTMHVHSVGLRWYASLGVTHRFYLRPLGLWASTTSRTTTKHFWF